MGYRMDLWLNILPMLLVLNVAVLEERIVLAMQAL